MTIRFRSTGSPIDFRKVFTLEEAASALMFNQTGKNCPTNISINNTEYAGFWEWHDILSNSMKDEESPLIAHLEDYNDNYVCIAYSIDRQDFEDWCNNKGIKPGFLFEEVLTVSSTDNSAVANQSTVNDVTTTQRIKSVIEQRIDLIISALSDAKYDVMSIPSGGKKYAMDKCLQNRKIFSSESVFKAAWLKASKERRLALENKEKYIRN